MSGDRQCGPIWRARFQRQGQLPGMNLFLT
jgi:hypothetical protein